MASVHLELIRPSKLTYAVLAAFEGDEALKEYHIHPSTISAMYQHTARRIIRESMNGVAKHYRVVVSNGGKDQHRTRQVVGYTTIFLEPALMLYSFGINVKYRKPWLLKKWMEKVHALFEGQAYHAALYAKNRRAIAFLERNNFEKTAYNAQDKSYLLCRFQD